LTKFSIANLVKETVQKKLNGSPKRIKNQLVNNYLFGLFKTEASKQVFQSRYRYRFMSVALLIARLALVRLTVAKARGASLGWDCWRSGII
ncbi:MAG: hypothetical protein AAGL17_03565, partial [Cyanobacteria bacterium J06576_12]